MQVAYWEGLDENPSQTPRENNMTAKLLYRLVDAAAEKVYRTATVLGPAVYDGLMDRMASASVSSHVGERSGYFSDGLPHPENTSDENWRSIYGKRV